MAAKLSSAPWADEPFALIDIASYTDKSDNAYIYEASEMANFHNLFIRGLNSILQQGPYVPDKSQATFNESDVKDFPFYVQSWCKMTDHCHCVEEPFMSPELERFSGKPNLMESPVHQHELFHSGVKRLLAYTQEIKPGEFLWAGDGGMKSIIDSFSARLVNHLYDWVKFSLGRKDLDSAGLKKVWQKSEGTAKQKGNISLLYDVLPYVLGTADKTFRGSGNFPPPMRVMPYFIKYWVAHGNGAWRFNPCDFWGQPRPLAFGPQDSA